MTMIFAILWNNICALFHTLISRLIYILMLLVDLYLQISNRDYQLVGKASNHVISCLMQRVRTVSLEKDKYNIRRDHAILATRDPNHMMLQLKQWSKFEAQLQNVDDIARVSADTSCPSMFLLFHQLTVTVLHGHAFIFLYLFLELLWWSRNFHICLRSILVGLCFLWNCICRIDIMMIVPFI